ncbi:hypothetical protein BC939DRAFT_451208 [Gamsiella multidivaricata]|uniref:uncharacterized protein n=1 Tax=Gamsiella multidivaricata TaxID=101098 RepID=UPI00221EDCAA|nr:uncharacterized protein BC939DRAFT_451208 [Gamsiella multidivaricata]KAI7823508.1 hypothetical protein BC939DRAFT_451208 [Gamsiella multidivaricata]
MIMAAPVVVVSTPVGLAAAASMGRVCISVLRASVSFLSVAAVIVASISASVLRVPVSSLAAAAAAAVVIVF